MVLTAFTPHNAFRVFSDLVQWTVMTGGHIGATRLDRRTNWLPPVPPSLRNRHVTFKHLSTFAILAATAACSDPTASPATTGLNAVAARAPGGGSAPRYKLRFINRVNMQGDGEIQSGWFPDTGVVLNTKTPWKSLTVRGATIDLVNDTHGSWTSGTCATFTSSATINRTTWDVGGNPMVSFQGRWFGTLSTS